MKAAELGIGNYVMFNSDLTVGELKIKTSSTT